MAVATLSLRMRSYRPGPAVQLLIGLGLALSVALAAIGPDRLIAQIEGDRGIVPMASSNDIQIGGIEVNTTGDDSSDARNKGWELAAKTGWQMLKGPSMSDGQIQSMVSAIVIEHEQIGPKRYVAKLGVIFDRQRAGQYLSDTVSGRSHSAPLLVIPVLHSGGVAQVFEIKGTWQKAWAEFNAGTSPIDYVRPVGSGGDSLMLTAGQPARRSRTWWRNLLDQFGASDVIVPVARLERQWPGGPVRGYFTARYGPDNAFLESFELTANDEAGIPAMMNQAIKRFDGIYSDGLARGLLKPDPTLFAQTQSIDAAFAAIMSASQAKASTSAATADQPSAPSSDSTSVASPTPAQRSVESFSVQFASPDAQAVDAALGAVRGASGVRGAATTSIAIGGTSVMRVSYAGSLEELAAALRARGWSVSVGSNALSIRR